VLAEKFKRMSKIKWMVLDGIFKNLLDYKYVPVEVISRDSGVDQHKLERILKSLSDEKLIEIKYTEYLGSAFTFLGLSLYSLWRFVKKGYVSMIGEKMGEGKESMVYNCYSDAFGELVIKFHKVGYSSFKRVREKREYGNLHYTVLMIRSARNEYKALKKLYEKVNVPKPYGCEGNALLMELIDGRELYRVKLENPKDVLDMIIEGVRDMYALGVIHGDLSQFNVLVNPEGVWFIDFPQSCEEGDEILKRDLKNILQYFEKVCGIKRDFDEVLRFVKGGG
jgi:RIO kinase 2